MKTKRKFKGICFLLIVLMLVGQAMTVLAGDGYVLEQKANMITPRSWMSAVEVDGKIYCINGQPKRVSGLVYSNKNEVYDIATDTWETKAPFPGTGRTSGYAGAVDGKIYYIGGKGVSNSYNEVYAYDPVTDTWESKAPMPYGGTYQMGGAVYNNKIYIFGGMVLKNNVYTDSKDILMYDPATNVWSKVATAPEGITYGSAVVCGDSVYVFYYDKKYFKFLPETNTIEKSGYHHAAVSTNGKGVVNNKIYVFGYHPNIVSQINKYDPELDSWSKVPVAYLLNDFNSYNSVVCYNNKAYIIGGGSGSNMNEYVTEFSVVPYNLKLSGGQTDVGNALSWKGNANVEKYTVKRSETTGGPYETLAEIKETMYMDTTAEAGKTYFYIVEASEDTGVSNELQLPKGGGNTPDPDPNPDPDPDDPTPTGKGAILEINMIDGTAKEFDVSMEDVSKFISEYNGGSKSYFMFDKPYNKGAFKVRTEYIIFDKIRDFEVNQYD